MKMNAIPIASLAVAAGAVAAALVLRQYTHTIDHQLNEEQRQVRELHRGRETPASPPEAEPKDRPGDEVWRAFRENEVAARAKYLRQVVRVRGEVARVYDDNAVAVVVLVNKGNFACQFPYADRDAQQAVKQLKPGQEVFVAGYCQGPDGPRILLSGCSVIREHQAD
jgi:hypothetical protein